jgi:O-antigen/teichoic acid export membrane protein
MSQPNKTIQYHFYLAIGIALFSVLLGFGLKIYLATIIEKEQLALYYTTIDIFSFSLLILIGFRSSMVVTYNKIKEDNAIVNIFRYFILVAILASWGLVLPYVKHGIGVSVDYWYLVSTILSMSLYLYLSNQLAMYRLYGLMNHSSFLEPLLSIFWFVMAYYVARVEGIQALFIMSIMGSLSLSVYIMIVKSKTTKEPLLKWVILDDRMRQFIKKSLISTLEFSSGMMMIYFAVFAFNHYYSIEELGDFQVVTKPILMYMITLFVFPVFRFLLPELSKLFYQKETQKIAKLKSWFYNFSIVISVSFTLLFYFFGQEIVATLFPAQYHGAYLYLTHLSFFFVFIMLNAYQVAFIKASGAFGMALTIRLSGILFFMLFFYGTRYFSESSVAIVFGLAMAYMGMFLFSWVIERGIYKRLSLVHTDKK